MRMMGAWAGVPSLTTIRKSPLYQIRIGQTVGWTVRSTKPTPLGRGRTVRNPGIFIYGYWGTRGGKRPRLLGKRSALGRRVDSKRFYI